jgi:hypothetical protein
MFRLKVRLAICTGDEVSVTLTSTDTGPELGAFGMPEMTPVVPQSVSAEGSEPLLMTHV